MTGVNGTIGAELARLDREAPEIHLGMRDILALYRPELSYQPGVDMAQMRYFALTTVRLRPGQQDNYAEYVKTLQNATRQKVKAEAHFAVYQVVCRVFGPTFTKPTLVLMIFSSLVMLTLLLSFALNLSEASD